METEKKNGGMVKTALLMVIITLSAKALGMLRDMLLAAYYATSPEAVAFDTASRLPLIIFDFVIGGVITATFIPIFNEIMIKKSKKEALDFAGSFFNIIFLICAVIALAGIIFAEPLVSFLAPEILPETAVLSSSLTRIMFPMIIFTGIAFSFVGLLQSFGNFILPALMSLVSNLIMVLYFVFGNRFFGIHGLAAAMTLGWAAQAVIQLPSALKYGFRFIPKLDLGSEYIRRAFMMALPILVSAWVQPFCSLINTRYASGIEGGIAAMGYANRLYLIIVGVFTFVATNLLFPYFSKARSSGDKESEEQLTRASIKTLMLIIIPITFGIFALSEPVISVIYGRGEFGDASVKMTAEALRFFAVGMPFYAISEICTKKFFAEQKTLPPMIAALVSILFNFIFVYLLADSFGIAGIALSSSLAAAVNAALNAAFRMKQGDKLLKGIDIIGIGIMLIASLVMCLCIKAISLEFGSELVSLVINVAVGVVIYFAVCLALGEELTRSVLTKIFKVKGRK